MDRSTLVRVRAAGVDLMVVYVISVRMVDVAVLNIVSVAIVSDCRAAAVGTGVQQ